MEFSTEQSNGEHTFSGGEKQSGIAKFTYFWQLENKNGNCRLHLV
jgi:hypothetical protein